MDNQALTFEEVKTFLHDHYAKEPSADKLQDVLVVSSPLTEIEQAEIVQILSRYQKEHGLTKAELKAKLKSLSNYETETDFFENGTLKPIRVVHALREQNDYLTTAEDDALRVYKSGVFRQDQTRVTAREIHNLLGDAVTSHHVNNVLSLLKDATTARTPRHTDYINLTNGRFCINAWELLDHSPDYPSVVQLPVEYNPNAKCPEFDTWLSDILPNEDDRFLLHQLFGYSMLQDVRFGKIAVLYGPTHTGKSTCLDLLRAFLGKENVSSKTLHALDNEENRFSRVGLNGKLANISADLSSRYLAGDSQVKQIATGDVMDVEDKNVKSFSFHPYATLWSSCNELPLSHDRSDAWYERLIILPFTQQHTGKAADRKLLERITTPEELSGLLNHAIAGLQMLLSENAFKETDATRTMLEAYRLDNDHVAAFLTEEYKLTTQNYVDEKGLYDHYETWCNDAGIKKLTKAKFRNGVEKWGATRKRKKTTNGERFFAFEGMEAL